MTGLEREIHMISYMKLDVENLEKSLAVFKELVEAWASQLAAVRGRGMQMRQYGPRRTTRSGCHGARLRQHTTDRYCCCRKHSPSHSGRHAFSMR